MSQELNPLIDYFNNLPDITLAYVFGSMATGRQTTRSDLDVAVKGKTALDAQTKAAIIEGLAKLTGRPVDLIDLSQAGEPLRGEILRHGKRIKGNNTLHAEQTLRHIYDSEDFLPIVRRLLAERRKQWMH